MKRLIMAIFLFSGTAHADAFDLLFTEIMYDSSVSGADGSNEWIELFNRGTASVDLSEWRIDDGSSPDGGGTLAEDSFIGAGSYAVLYDASYISATDFATNWNLNLDEVTLIGVSGWSTMILSNDGDSLSLWQATGNTSVLSLTYTDLTLPNSGRSIYLTDLTATDPTNMDNWSFHDKDDAIKGGTSVDDTFDYATPASSN